MGSYSYHIGQIAFIRGFLRGTDGSYTFPFIAPNDDGLTVAAGIDDAGEIVGYSYDASNVYHGFLLNGGTFTVFDEQIGASTAILSVNNPGFFAGGFAIGPNSPFTGSGFTSINGVIVQVDYPRALATLVTAIGPENTLAGYFYQSGTTSGFIQSPDGVMHPIPSTPTVPQILPAAISTKTHTVVGSFRTNKSLKVHGFAYDYITKHFNVIDYPGAVHFTYITGINSTGQIVGYADLPKRSVAFIGTPKP